MPEEKGPMAMSEAKSSTIFSTVSIAGGRGSRGGGRRRARVDLAPARGGWSGKARRGEAGRGGGRRLALDGSELLKSELKMVITVRIAGTPCWSSEFCGDLEIICQMQNPM